MASNELYKTKSSLRPIENEMLVIFGLRYFWCVDCIGLITSWETTPNNAQLELSRWY